MTVSTRIATIRDAAALADLAAATFPLACPPDAAPKAIEDFIAANLTRARFDEYLASADHTIVIAEDAAEAVGYAMLVAGAPDDADVAAAIGILPTIKLSKFYTRRERHGSGVAATLMGAALDAARGQASGIWLGVNSENARAIRFYEKSGFAKVGTMRFKLGDRLELDFVLERSLAHHPTLAPHP